MLDDLIDWHGCNAVHFDPEKLSGRATVGNSRLDADTVLINFEAGLSIDEIVDSYSTDRCAVEEIIAFAVPRRLKQTA